MAKTQPTKLISGGILLNFERTPIWLPHPIRKELMLFPGVEWRFQAGKLMSMDTNRRWSEVRMNQWYDSVALAPTAGEAKRLGHEIPLVLQTWDQISYHMMLEAVLAKFTQHKRAAAALRSTGKLILVEHRRDRRWGDNLDGTGKNLMGRILMQVREVIS